MDVPGLLIGITRIVAMKGKRIEVLDLKEKLDETAILKLLLGPTGQVRAPAARVGTTLLIGFNDEIYDAELIR